MEPTYNKTPHTDPENSGNGNAAADKPSAEPRYRANSDFVLREIAGETILVPVGKSAEQLNGMLAINETFRFIWEQFQQPHTVCDVVAAAAEQFDGAPDEMEKDIRSYVAESVRYGVLCVEEA